jgi:hypothetical protein
MHRMPPIASESVRQDIGWFAENSVPHIFLDTGGGVKCSRSLFIGCVPALENRRRGLAELPAFLIDNFQAVQYAP